MNKNLSTEFGRPASRGCATQFGRTASRGCATQFGRTASRGCATRSPVQALRAAIYAVAFAALGACGDPAANTATDAADSGSRVDAAPNAPLRGQRYCEILLASVSAGGAHVDVYTTFGLNECPDAAWSAVDPAKVATDQGVTKAVLNGPRYGPSTGLLLRR